MDNFRLDVTSQGKENFIKVFELLGKKKVTGYRVDKNRRMVLYWTDADNATPLPYEMNLRQAADFVDGWLNTGADWGREPDHDGDNGRGWRVYNEDWGHVDHQWQAFVAITPAWAMYGK